MSVLKVDTPSDLQLNKLYLSCNPLVWMIEYVILRNGRRRQPHITYGHGFIYNEFLVTTWHSLPQAKTFVITARPLNEHGFNYKAELVHEWKDWDIALLKIQGLCDNPPTCTFPLDSSLSELQPLLLIGCSSVSSQNVHEGSLRLSRVAYRCVNDIQGNLASQVQERNFFDLVPEYQVLGDVCSKCTLHAEVPLIHMSCVGCFPRSSGCPLFNDKGEVVGMMVFSQVNGRAFAIHSSLLKRALEEYPETKKRKRTTPIGKKALIMSG